MAFQMYTSGDAAGPGALTGEANKLILLLRAILVDGYGAIPAAGWSEPIAAAGNCAAFRPGAGTRFGLFVNDNGPNATSTYKEAWVTGWESVSGIAAPVGSGTGQFPTAAQLLTTGHGVVRKSASANAVGRDWIAFADPYTCYLFIASGDAVGSGTYTYGYTMLFFGDFYSVKSTDDDYRGMIVCRTTENSSGNNFEGFGSQVAAPTTTAPGGFYLARTYGGAGGSVAASHQGDYGKNTAAVYAGKIQYPNGPDNSLYLSPIWIFEPTSGTVRGRFRGLYHVCHEVVNFTDGQDITGAGDFAGKTFKVIRPIFSRVSNTPSMVAVETSDTLDTNT